MWDITKLSQKYTPYQIQKIQKHQPVWKNCPVCGVTFDAQSYIFRVTAIYPRINETCSSKCKRIYGGRKNKKVFKSYVCKGCDLPFVPHKNKPHQQFCNKKCRGLFLRGKDRPEVQKWIHKLQPPKNSISQQGTKWLSQYNITHTEHIITVGTTKYRVDGYDENTNTVYEFLGSFWHGNPAVYNANDIHPVCKVPFGMLYQQTITRIKLLEQAGYNVVIAWSNR